MHNDINRRITFNNNAQTYREIRPKYPEALFDTLIQTAKLPGKAHLLEIGPGTGQATLPLAKRGYDITAIELGVSLANEARNTLKDYPNVRILTGAFEDVDLPYDSFDLIYSATAFHWIKPDVKFTKSHRILKSNGYLAVIHTNHVSNEEGDAYFFATAPIYKKYDPTDDETFRLPRTEALKPSDVDVHLFTLVLFKTFPLIIRYTANEYVQLLSTFSPTLSMPIETREKFLADITKVINDQFGGSIDKHFAMSLTIARKKAIKQIKRPYI